MKRRFFGLSLILCLTFVICIASVFSGANVASAENVDVLVDLANDSLLVSYSDYFAYTNSKSIIIAKDNKLIKYEEKRLFDRFVDIAINSTHILAIVQIGDSKELWAYKYSNKIEKIEYDFSQTLDCDYMVKLFTDENDGFLVMENNVVKQVPLTDTESNSGFFIINSTIEDGTYKNAKAFALLSRDVLYCIIDGNFYVIDQQTAIDPDLSAFCKITGNFVDMTVIGDTILLLSDDGVYEYDGNKSAIALTENGLNSNSKICSSLDKKTNTNYVYTKSNLNAVNMYVYTSQNLEYFGCFDNTVYEHPQEYDLVAMYKVNSDVTLYSSPRHLQRMGIIPKDSYYIALSERDEYVYVYYHNNVEDKTLYGYIKKTANVTLCPASKEGEYGSFVQPLHENTPIYKYPFDGAGSEKILDASIHTQLIFIDNVGQDGTFSWGWYKVGFVDSKGNTQYGYVRTYNLSPYTQFSAPALSKSAKLTSKKLGHYITLYALPFENQEDAIEVAQLPEGTKIYLKEKYNKKSKWTAVYYEGKTAYVRTANVKAQGLTSWQIALAITIPCVVIAIAVSTTLIILAKKKKRI